MKCKCGSQFLPLEKNQKKCVTCEIIEYCTSIDRKCWNEEIITKNFSYASNEDYIYIRNEVKPTYQHFFTPAQIFDFIETIKNEKRDRLALYLPSFIRRENDKPITGK